MTALLTLLAMLIAPLCASFCRAHVCDASSSSAQTDGCHKSFAVGGDSPDIGLTAAHTCGLQELPTVALNETTNRPDSAKQAYATHASLNLFPPSSPLLAGSGTQSQHPDPESRIESSSVRPPVLRV